MNAELLQTSLLVNVLFQYLGKTLSISELEDWLVGNLQDILSSGDSKAIEIANEVDALLVEESEKLITEEQLKKKLSVLISEKLSINSVDTSGSCNKVISDEPFVTSSLFVRARHSFAPAEADR